MSDVHREARIYFTVGLMFVIEQTIKWIAYSVLPEESFYVIPGVFKVELFLNPGIIFSFTINNLLVVILSSVILIVILLMLIRNDKRDNEIGVWAYSLLLAGGLSNFIDRIRIGATIDYLHFFPDNLPIFNISDLMLVVGLVLLVMNWLRRDGKKVIDNK